MKPIQGQFSVSSSDPGLVTAREVATILGVDVETVRLWARQRKIPSLKFGYRTLRFRMADVLAVALQQRTGSSGERDGGSAFDVL